MSTQPDLPPLNIAIPPHTLYKHPSTHPTRPNSQDAGPRSPGYPRGFESLLAPLAAPPSFAQTSSITAEPEVMRQSIDSSMFSNASDMNLDARDRRISEDQAAGLWDRLAMIEGRRYNINSYVIAEDRKQCRKLLSRLNTAGSGSLSSFTCLVSELFQLRPTPGPATVAWDEKFGRRCGSKGKDLVLMTPFRCEFGYNLHFGNDVRIGPNCYFNDASLIRIGNGVRIGKNVRFNCNQADSVNQENFGVAVASKIEICDGVVIGDDVTIFGGVSVGARSRICANITLTESISEGRHLMIYQQSLPVTRRSVKDQNQLPAETPSFRPMSQRENQQSPGFQQSNAAMHTASGSFSKSSKAPQAQLPTTCDPYATSSAYPEVTHKHQ